MDSAVFLSLMERLAPLELAAEWDNVGLLVAPRAPRPIARVLLTIDLTERVLDEAVEFGADAIVSYHPPIFAGLKRVVPTDPQGNVLLRVIQGGFLVYSPHTALDAVAGGVNDWLCDAFEGSLRRAIQPHDASGKVGQGRYLELERPLSLAEAVARLKRHLGLERLRIAAGGVPLERVGLRSVALCAGAGGSVVSQVRADLYVTGEMRHHDVLDACARGCSVILTEHSNSERGYLSRLRDELTRGTALSALVSARDEDPLRSC